MVNQVTSEIMTFDTATAQLVYQLASIVITTIVGIVGVYLKNFLSTNKYVKEYNLYNDKVERVIDNAIHYAEAKAKHFAGEKIAKKDLAIKYIEVISPDIIAKEGNKLDMMIERKVLQTLKK